MPISAIPTAAATTARAAALARVATSTVCRHAPCRRISQHQHRPPLGPSESPPNMSYASAVKHCREIVQRHDHDNYLVSLFLPARLRPFSWGIRAFTTELAAIRENVRENSLGRMRFQFWRETIDQIHAGAPPHHPIALVLAAAVHEGGVSPHRLKRIINSRADNFQTQQYSRLSELEEYGEGTASASIYMHLELLGVKNIHMDHIASHLGKAIGVATLLRGTPFHLRNRILYIPAEVCAKHGVSAEKVFRQAPGEEFADAVFEVATLANDHLITARTHAKKDGIDKSAFPALLPVVSSSKWLSALEKVNFHIFDPSLQRRDPFMAFRLWVANRRSSF